MSMKSRRRFTRFMSTAQPKKLLWATTVLLVAVATNALAESSHRNRLLRGDYTMSQMVSCVTNKSFFDVPAFAFNDATQWEAIVEVESSVVTLVGTFRFDGEGTWQFSDGEAFSIVQGTNYPGGAVARNDQFGCEGSYEVQRDRSVRLSFTSCQATNPPFLVFGENITRDGKLSRDKKTLILWNTEPDVEQVSVPGGGPVVLERLCNAVATTIHAAPKKEDDRD